MQNKMLSAIFVMVLSAVALLPITTQAAPILVQDFWGKKSDGTNELFATLKVDVIDATQWAGDIYQADSWKSFTVYGQEILPANNFGFIALFNITDLYAGLNFFSFDVLEELSNVSFQGFFDPEISVEYYTLLDGNFSDIYTDGIFTTPTSVVATPASLALIFIGFFGLALRRTGKM